MNNESSDRIRRRREATGFLYKTVADALRARLAEVDSSDRSRHKLPTLRELASEFQVSTMTVRQAIGALQKEGLIHHVRGVGSFAVPPRRSRAGEQMTLAMIGGNLSGVFQSQIVSGLQKACQRRDWALQLFDACFDTEQENHNLIRLPQSNARSAVVLPPFSSPSTVDTLRLLNSLEFPLVMIDQTVAGLRADVVTSDHEQGAYHAAKHLLDHGCREVLMLTHPPISSSVAERIDGFKRALRGAGTESPDQQIVYINPDSHLQAYQTGQPWLAACETIRPELRKGRGPLGVVAVEAWVGWGVYKACRQQGLSIPQDVSVISFDDLEFGHSLDPPITIITQRTGKIGEAAVQLLAERLDTEESAAESDRIFKRVVIDIDLIERGSVRSVSGRSREASNAHDAAMSAQ